MSRSKLRNMTGNCADCGTPDPSWASINRGIFLCDECSSIHRSLGRHISQVISLKKGHISSSRIQMVQTLSNNGANSIWEHVLLDPLSAKQSRKKPQPRDPLHPVKADFIRAKYQMLAFIFKPGKEDTLLHESDLSKQLHSSVRTSNLETSLRLLSQGADPNYYHPEKCTTPLHVAAKAGQLLQIELLIVYGSDPGACDNFGKTPIDYARTSGFKDIANRLIECMYELTDKLAYFLCNRKPDHINGQHFIIPEISDLIIGDLSKEAKRKLQKLPNHLFEELAMDVYDEVDRRETESIWISTQETSTLGFDCSAVPFLPVNPEFSSTRNQGRQKLARFSAKEFATLIIDILSDAKRRQNQHSTSLIISQERMLLQKRDILSSHCKSEMSDEEPLYDSVASDDDYLSAEQIALLVEQATSKSKDPVKLSDSNISNEKDNFLEEDKSSSLIPVPANVENLKRQLNESEYKMTNLKSKIQVLNSTVQKLTSENRELRVMLQQAGFKTSPMTQVLLPNGHEVVDTEPVLEVKSPRSSSHQQRPASMYETREGYQHRVHWDKSQMRDTSEYESPTSTLRQGVTQSMYQCPTQTSTDLAEGLMRGMPLAEEVKRRTDQLTKRIQELWTSMQNIEKRDALVPCAERIRVAVAELTAIFPQNVPDENIRSALRQLNLNTGQLQTECASLKRILTTNTTQVDHSYFLHQVRTCAYEMASATKQLVTKFQL